MLDEVNLISTETHVRRAALHGITLELTNNHVKGQVATQKQLKFEETVTSVTLKLLVCTLVP